MSTNNSQTCIKTPKEAFDEAYHAANVNILKVNAFVDDAMHT